MFTSIKPLFRRQNKYLMGVGALLVLALTPLAVAEDSLDLLRIFQKNKMPTNQELRESYTNFTYKPYEREDLSFSILIPKNGWRDIEISVEPETLQQDEQQLIPLAKQMAPESEKGEAKIEVHYMRLNMEVDLYDYVSMFLEDNKDHFDLLMRRKGQYNRRRVDEVLLASEQNSNRYLARLTFSRHGDRIFLISSSALEPEFGRYAEYFTAASVSFSAVINSPNAFAEKMVDFTSAESSKLQFHYPATWTIEELKTLDVGRIGIDMALTVKDEKGQTVLTYGYIHVAMKKMPQDDNRLSDKINVLSIENGGQVVSCSSQYNQTSWGARNLIDGQLGSSHGYASRDRSPAEIVFSLPKIETITQLCFNPYTTESPNTWAKLVKVEVSTESPEKGFAPVGEFTLHNRHGQTRTPLADQCFDIGAVQARYIKLHLLSNHGDAYIEMGEFKAYAAAN